MRPLSVINLAAKKATHHFLHHDDFLETVLVPFYWAMRLTGWGSLQKHGKGHTFTKCNTAFARIWLIWAIAVAIPVTLFFSLRFCFRHAISVDDPVADLVVYVCTGLSGFLTVALLGLSLYRLPALPLLLYTYRPCFTKYLASRSRKIVLFVAVILFFLPLVFTVIKVIAVTEAVHVDPRLEDVLRGFSLGPVPVSPKTIEYVEKGLIFSSSFSIIGMYMLDGIWVLVSIAFAFCFGATEQTFRAENKLVPGGEKRTSSAWLEDYVKMVRAVRKVNDKFSLCFLLRYGVEVLLVIASAMPGAQSPIVVLSLGQTLAIAAIRTTGFICLADQTSAVLERFQTYVTNEPDPARQQSLHFVLAEVKSSPVAISLGGIIFVNREFVATIIGVLLTYILLLYDKSDRDGPSNPPAALHCCNHTRAP